MRNIEFKRANTVFQNHLNKDINIINKDPLLFIPADKSSNFYKVSKDTYSKLQQDNIKKSYKKSNISVINNINKEAKVIAAELKLCDRIEQFNQREAFVNFQNDPKRRLINPECRLICIPIGITILFQEQALMFVVHSITFARGG